MSANPETISSATVLCVDDEANILSSLQRLFRPAGYRIFTAKSGAQGLEIMAHENIDLVISEVVDTFLRIVDSQFRAELRLSSDDLREGMVLSRDLVSQDGVMLLTKGRTLNSTVIHKVTAFEKGEGRRYTIYIQSD